MFASGRRLGLSLVLALALAPLPAATVRAHDSLSPAGAPHSWLPAEPWVYRHWVPFDEQQIERSLDLPAGQLEAYLYDDHRTLWDLARDRDVDPDTLIDDLVAPWQTSVSATHVAVLRDRTQRLLTQGHLAQHVFFHVYHGVDLTALARRLLGISSAAYDTLRLQRATPVDIARAHGVSAAALRAEMRGLFNDDLQRGVDTAQAAPAESRRIMERQLARLSCWSVKPLARFDPTNPFGKQLQQHGGHLRGWPRTPAERSLDESRVELGRARLPASCWPRPTTWTVGTHMRSQTVALSPAAGTARRAGDPRLVCAVD